MDRTSLTDILPILSMTVVVHFTSRVEDNKIYLTAVRTGPGRTFTVEDQPDNAHINCTANSIGTNMMF